SLGSMQASAFNKILTPLLNIELASGNVKGLRFDMKGTDYRNTGTLNFDYDNLKVSVLNKNQKGKQKSKKVTSFLLNTILINESNPNKKGEYTVGRINYQRAPEYTFFKTLWKSLFEGIKQSAGVDSEREEKLIGMADKAKETAKNTKSTVEKVKSKVRGWFEKDKKE